MHHLILRPISSSDVRFTNIAVRSTGRSGLEMKYGVPAVLGQWCNYLSNFSKL